MPNIQNMNKNFLQLSILTFISLSNLFGQQKSSFILKGGLGQNISLTQFFANSSGFNYPTSGYVSIELGVLTKSTHSSQLYFGLELEQLNYYPSEREKLNLGSVGLKAGKTHSFDLNNPSFAILFIRGLSLNSFIATTSSRYGDSIIYQGGPLKNLNLGGFLGCQFLFVKRKMDVGISPELNLKGFKLIGSSDSPGYVKSNYRFQASLNFILRYRL
jgi:hypothetical protein